MDPPQKEYLKKVWSELLGRFRELSEREIEYEVEWDEVARNVRAAYGLFSELLKKYILLCETILKELDAPWKPYRFYINLMDQLYGNLYYIRRCFLSWFAAAFPNRLLYYLFFCDLFSTLSKEFPTLENVRCIIGPTGAIRTERFGLILVGRTTGLLESQLRADLAAIAKAPVHGIECDPGESLDRQLILGHELFHILLQADESRLNQVVSIYHNSSVRVAFTTPLFSENHIVELFCDFAAARHFGPAYGKAFIEEIMLYEKQETPTHPSRIVRLWVILEALSGKLRSPYLARMRLYSRKNAGDELRLRRKDVGVLIKEFKRILKDMRIRRYIPKDIAGKVKQHIRQNIPIVYQDIRDLLNNLPPDKRELTRRQQDNYDAFSTESVRKSVMWRQFTKAMTDLEMHPLLPDELTS